MELIPVISSNIKAIGFQEHNHEEADDYYDKLFIQFSHGKIYSYLGVSKETFNKFLESESKGSFFYQKIYGKYQTFPVEIN